MNEAYAFLTAFTMQILVVSVLHPAWFTRYALAKAEAQLSGWDRKYLWRFLHAYRAVNMGIAVLGLVLLGWLFSTMRRPDWNVGLVSHLNARYIAVQILPFVLVSLLGTWIKRKALTLSPPEAKRTASLQRRGLFDIVSPSTVFLAVLAYFLSAAFAIYIQQRPSPGFSGYRILGTVTMVYASNAFAVYWLLYGRKRWPLETLSYRVRAVGVQVKIIFYSSTAVSVFLSFNVMLRLLDMRRWAPFALSVYFVIVMFLTSLVLFALRRQAEADRPDLVPAS